MLFQSILRSSSEKTGNALTTSFFLPPPEDLVETSSLSYSPTNILSMKIQAGERQHETSKTYLSKNTLKTIGFRRHSVSFSFLQVFFKLQSNSSVNLQHIWLTLSRNTH